MSKVINIPREWLISEWLLDGNYLDTSWNWSNWTAINTTQISTDIWYQSKALEFNGSSSYFTVFSIPHDWITNITLSAWIYPTTITDSFFFTKDDVTDRSWSFNTANYSWHTNELNALFFVWWLYSYAYTWNILQSWKWQMVTVTRDSSWVIEFYYNWNHISNTQPSTVSWTINSWYAPVIIWKRDYWAQPWFFNWNIQTARIYNRVLSTQEINILYKEWLRKLWGAGLAPLTDGLVAYYDFNGDANDIIGGNNGTVTGATLTTDRFGNSNRAYNFSADGDKISCPASNYWITSNFTLSAWIKTWTLVDGENMIFHKDWSSWFRDFQFRVNNSDWTLTLYRGDTWTWALADFKTTWYSVEDWTYHFVTATFNSSVWSAIYIDWISRATNWTTTSKALSTQALYIWWRVGDSVTDFNGKIEDCMIFNKALSASEVLALYQLSSTRYLTPLLH